MNKNIDLVMICAGSQGKADKNHVPLGLLYVGSSLKRNGYDVKIRHLLPQEFDNAAKEIKLRMPLWVGVSVLSGVTTSLSVQFSELVKRYLPDTSVVWGGHHPSAVPEECLKEECVDFVIIGEGEETALEFSEAIGAGADFSDISGLGFKNPPDHIIINKPRPFLAELDKLELDWELVDLGQYRKKNLYGKVPVGFYSSRGCPYNCAFCSTPLYSGASYRAHSPAFVLRNLLYLKEKYGFDSVFFSDDNFMIDPARGLEIIAKLSAAGISVDTVDIRLNQITEEILAEFKKYNVNGIFFGYESGNNRILKLVNKGLTIELIKGKVELIKKYGIPVWASGIIGIPTESRDEMYATIDFSNWLRDNLPEPSTVSVYRYMPLPRTRLLQLAINEGFMYPRNVAEWKKIDPITSYYGLHEWIKWATPKDEEYFAFAQELSRNGMLNYVKTHSNLINCINNFFVKRFRAKMFKREITIDLYFRLFDVLRCIYKKARRSNAEIYRSDAIKK